jgi:hypothetical protein
MRPFHLLDVIYTFADNIYLVGQANLDQLHAS